MWLEADDSDSTGTQLTLADVALPPAVGEGFAQLYGTDERPETAAEWVATVRETVERVRGRSPTVDDLCTTEDGDHAFVGADGSRTYVCALDPLVYPFLTGETGAVRSTTPVRGSEVTFEITGDGTAVSHEDALVSIGVSDHVEGVDEMSVETVYRQVCGYIQTFEDREEYETWADDVEAATTALPAREGVAIARELVDALFDADADRATGDCCSGTGCC